MSNAALDILNSRYTAISNDLKIKEQEYIQRQDEINNLVDNIAKLQNALIDIGLAIKTIEGKLNESTQSRNTSKSKKATP